MVIMEQGKIVVFNSKQIRRIWHDEQWFFSVADVCEVLTDSPDAGAYWRKLKQRLNEESSEVVSFCHGLKLEASDGKRYKTDCANAEGLFRIIQNGDCSSFPNISLVKPSVKSYNVLTGKIVFLRKVNHEWKFGDNKNVLQGAGRNSRSYPKNTWIGKWMSVSGVGRKRRGYS